MLYGFQLLDKPQAHDGRLRPNQTIADFADKPKLFEAAASV